MHSIIVKDPALTALIGELSPPATKLTAMRAAMLDRIRQHGENLLAIFPNATEKDPVKLCKKLRRMEARTSAIALHNCNVGMSDADYFEATGRVLARVNALLGNVREYQPKTGAPCGCRRGVQRDNCAACEGTGQRIDFRAIRNAPPVVPVIVNGDPRGYALKIDDAWMRTHADYRLHRDWGGYGIIAPDMTDAD